MKKRLKKVLTLLMVFMLLFSNVAELAIQVEAQEVTEEGQIPPTDDEGEPPADDEGEPQDQDLDDESDCIESCVEGCTGEGCECTCHSTEEPPVIDEEITHMEGCAGEECVVEGCTCTCHSTEEPPVIDEEATHIEGCIGEECAVEGCACTCHAVVEEATCIEGCVEGCTGEECECECHNTEEAVMSEAAVGYTEKLSALALRIENFKKMDSATEAYITEENALWEELAALEEALGIAKADGTITVEEYNLLFAELDRVTNLLLTDFVPEEEASEYASSTYSVGYKGQQSFNPTDCVWKYNSTGWRGEFADATHAENAWLVERDGTYYYAGENGYIYKNGTYIVDGVECEFDKNGAWVQEDCAVDGIGANSSWNYYWSNAHYYGISDSLKPLTNYVPQKPVGAKYADVVLGENSAANVECHVPTGTGLDAGQVTEGSDPQGWGCGLGDCEDALVSAKPDNKNKISKIDNVDDDYFWVMYHNIDTDANGNPICVSLSLWDYAIHTGGGTTNTRIGFTTNQGVDGGKTYVKDNAPGVSVNNVSWLTVLYEFYTHDGDPNGAHNYDKCNHRPVQVNGSTSYYDVDGWQGVHVHGSNKSALIATNGDPVNGEPTAASILNIHGENDPYIYASTFKDDTNYTTSHAFTEQFTTAGDNENSFKRTFVFNGGGGIYHDAEPVVETGVIEVTKKCTDDTGKVFSISVNLTGGSANNTLYYSVAGENEQTVNMNGSGEAAITANLKHGQKLIITGVPAGTKYTVEESNPGYYAPAYSWTGDTGDYTIAAKEVEKVTVTNTRKTGSVTVSKNVVNGAGNESFTYTATIANGGAYTLPDSYASFTLTAGASKILTGLPAGATLKITETDTGATETYSINGAADQTGREASVVVAENRTQTIAYTNTFGKLQITKNSTVKNRDFTIHVKVDGAYLAAGTTYKVGTTTKSVGSNESIVLQAGQTAVINGLPMNVSYSVEEAESSSYGYDVGYTNKTGTITSDTAAVSITNSTKTTSTGTITVNKTLQNYISGTKSYTFEMQQVADKNGNNPIGTVTTKAINMTSTTGSITFGPFNYKTEDLNGGSSRTFYYRIKETTPDSISLDADQSIYVVEVTLTGATNSLTTTTKYYKNGSEVSSITFANILLGALDVNKTLASGSTAANDRKFTIQVTLDGPDYAYSFTVGNETKTANSSGYAQFEVELGKNGSIRLEKVPTGTKYTVKELTEYGYSPSSAVSGTIDERTGTNTGINSATITNTELKMELPVTVVKKLDYKDEFNPHGYDFKIVELDDQGNELPNGTGITKSEINIIVAMNKNSGQGLFELLYKGSDLKGEKDKHFRYKIYELTAGLNENEVDADTNYYIVEVVLKHENNNLTATPIIKKNGTDSSIDVSFTNTLLGNLIVSKQVIPADGQSIDTDKEFTISVTTNRNHQQNWPSDSNEVSAKSYNHGHKESYLKYPIGTKYNVEEAASSAYGYKVTYVYVDKDENEKEVPTSAPKDGTLIYGTTRVKVINTELSTDAAIRINKTLTIPSAMDTNWKFRIVEVDFNGNEIGTPWETGDLTVQAGQKSSFIDVKLSDYYGSELNGETDGTRDYYYKITEIGTDNNSIDYDEHAEYVKVTLDGTTKDTLVTRTYVKEGNSYVLVADANKDTLVSYNNTLLGAVKVKKEVTGTTIDAKTFAIDVVLDGPAYAYTVNIGTAAYTATPAGDLTIRLSLPVNGEALIEKIPIGTAYTITEVLDSRFGYDDTYAPTVSGTVVERPAADADIARVLVTNRELTASVTVTGHKDVLNPDGNTDDWTFRLVEVTDKTGAVPVTEETDANGKTEETAGYDQQTILSDYNDGVSNEDKFTFQIDYVGSDLDRDDSDGVTDITVSGNTKSRVLYYKMTEIGTDNWETDFDESIYVFEITLKDDKTEPLPADGNTLSAEITNVYQVKTDVAGMPVAEALGMTTEPTFKNILLGVLEVKKDLNLIDSKSVHNDPFKMHINITGDLIKKDMPYTINEVEHKASEDGKITLEVDLKDMESVYIGKIPHDSEFHVVEDPTTNYGFDVSYKVDDGKSNKAAAGGEVAAKTTNDPSTSTLSVVTNQEMTDSVIVKAEKRIKKKDGNTYKFSFSLVEVDKHGKEIAGGVNMTTDINCVKAEDFSFKLDYRTTMLKGQPEQKFYYRVTEITQDNINYLDADESAYIVEVTLTGKTNYFEAEITDIEKDGKDVSKITFENILLGELKLRKKVVGANLPTADYKFRIEADLEDGYYYAILNGEGQEIKFENGQTELYLHHDDVIEIFGIPHGTRVKIDEVFTRGANFVRYTVDSEEIIRGGTSTEVTVTTASVSVVCSNYYVPDTVHTGDGANTGLYAMLGLAAVAGLAAVIIYKKKKAE